MAREQHLHSSVFIKDIVIGMADGLTVPFALAAGMSGAVSKNSLIVAAGLAEIVAGSIAMGLGGYLAGQTESEHYEAELEREYAEVENYPDQEREEVRAIFAEYGLDEASQHLIVDAISQDKKKWVDFMMRFELGLEQPELNRARNSALTLSISYIIGGIIPLSTYFLLEDTDTALISSIIVTLFALFVFGFWKSRVTGQKQPLIGAIKVMLTGALAAGASYFVARSFGAERATSQ